MSEHKPHVTPEHRLTVKEILGMLVGDGLVGQADAEALIA